MPEPTEPQPKGGIEVIKPDRARRPRRYSLWFLIFRRPLPLERETSWFIFANALDVFMTCVLFHRFPESGRRVGIETNPIARLFWDGSSMVGLVFFKFAIVAFVVLIAQIIANYRVEVARKLLNFGTVIVGGVVVYTIILLLRNMGIP